MIEQYHSVQPVCSILGKSQHVVKVPDGDLHHPLHSLEEDEKYHRECEISDMISERFVKVYGQPPDNESFPDIIYTYDVDRVNSIVEQHKEKSRISPGQHKCRYRY